MAFTAKVVVSGKQSWGEGAYACDAITFTPDYAAGRNAEWAEATPSLSLGMTVKRSIGERIKLGDTYTLTFDKE